MPSRPVMIPKTHIHPEKDPFFRPSRSPTSAPEALSAGHNASSTRTRRHEHELFPRDGWGAVAVAESEIKRVYSAVRPGRLASRTITLAF